MNPCHIGVDLGGTIIKTVVLSPHGKVLVKLENSTQDDPHQIGKWKAKIRDLIISLEARMKKQNFQIKTCGLAAPGLTRKDHSCISYMPGRMSGLENFIWSEYLNRPVLVINDAKAACLAEYVLQDENEVQHMIMLTLGTGVGGACIINGQLFQGALSRAGHIGHITVDHEAPVNSMKMAGSLEEAIGNKSISKRTFGKYKTTFELIKAYENNDHLATYWWLNSIQKLACGLASMINILSPDLIVIGGGIAAANESLFEPLKEFLALYEWRPGNHQVPIIKAQRGHFAGAIGAALFAMKK